MVFAASAALVVLLGAVAGILGGFILALALRAGREKIDTSGPELLGAVPYKPDDLPAKKDIEVGYALGIAKLSGDLSFMNIAKAQEEIEAAAAGNEALILKLSKLDTIDTTAADKLDETLDSLMARGVHVKLVRPIKETSDHYTRYELRRLMQDFKFYPSVRTAMHSLAEECAAGMEPQRPDTWLADAPAPRRLRKVAAEASIIDGDRPGGGHRRPAQPRRRRRGLRRRLPFWRTFAASCRFCSPAAPSSSLPTIWKGPRAGRPTRTGTSSRSCFCGTR